MSGQGHRAGLKRQRPYDDGREAFEAQYGEERALFIAGNGGRFDNYTPARPIGGGHNGPHANNVGLRGSTPRIFANGGPPQTRGRPGPAAATPRDPGRARAPSPRAAGTVRFNARNAARRAQKMAGRSIISPAEQAAAALRTVDAQRDRHDPEVVVLDQLFVSSPQASGQQAQPPSPRAAAPDSVSVQVHFNQALFCVAHTGEELQYLLKKHPNCHSYLEEARKRLIAEALKLAQGDDDREVTRYNQCHPERKWIIEAAAEAKSLIEQDDEVKIKARRAAHQHESAILEAAKSVFMPLIRRDSAALLDIDSQIGGEAATESAQPTQPAQSVQSTESAWTIVAAAPNTPIKASSSTRGDTATSAGSRISLPPSPAKGSLVATFIDCEGKFQGVHQIAIDAPVQASISITSRSARFKPQELIKWLEAMAQSMIDRTRGLEGAHLEDDGLWVEDV